MSDWKKITQADLDMLPVGHRQKIPENYLDANNHMNVMWYPERLADSVNSLVLSTRLSAVAHPLP
jgi:hypothetical protein